MTEDLMACTCPHHVHRNAFCKHMAAVETATDHGTLDAFSSEGEDDAEPDDCDCDGLGYHRPVNAHGTRDATTEDTLREI
ncbi:hypothetical protein [Haladaptatus litoreus]|uniref:hypothetical protein n=1 Tax=Haladaptatus litoreus TaxID=553468 RepID=UPI001FE30B96|nr:hypothetical protein [Haladaptatus litoreus]